MQILDQIQNHPRPPISLHQQQIQSLTETVSFLQQFLETGYTSQVSYNSEADPLEMQIADAAHAVEDVIESSIVDNILGDGEKMSAVDLYESVQKVIDDMEYVKKEASDVKEKMQNHVPRADSSTFVASSSSGGPEQYLTMVGFDDILRQVLDKLASDESGRQIISITGMGGMGKSTLAKNVYHHQLVVDHFDFCAWVTVSQQYKIRKILLKVLEGGEEKLSQVDEEYDLGDILHKTLMGRRYLIILDDIWNIEVWDELRCFVPDNNNGSRIMMTTRLSNLAGQINGSHNIEMPFLDEDNSWKLFCKHVFKEEECPLELKDVGKMIVYGCKGLPLSISVVGGILAKSKRTTQYWEEIAENLSSTVNLENHKHCLQILYMSYYNLPVHLKPYFLYMGVILSHHEDFIPIYMLVPFFVVEGFVKPINGKNLEEAAVEYVTELIERNLILIDKTEKLEGWIYKDCRMHDLFKDLCLRESKKQNFVHVVVERSINNIPHNIDSVRRICVAENIQEEEVRPFLESASLLRSLWWMDLDPRQPCISLSSIHSRLLRVAATKVIFPSEEVQKVNLRLILVNGLDQHISLSSISLSRFWNLQMFWVLEESSDVLMAPYEIWMMPHLRCIVLMRPFYLPDPPSGETDCGIILENLHILVKVFNFKCSEEVVKRIPRIKHLELHYTEAEESHHLDNLGYLQQLEHLVIKVEMQSHLIHNPNLSITFPRSLIRLGLHGTSLRWVDVTTNIGSLPHLQILHLMRDSVIGAKWETIEGQFCHLKLLSIVECRDLEYWMTESTHFPHLQFLHLEGLNKLEEIPSSLGDIPTLELIQLEYCCYSINCSAISIKEEQEELGNEDLQVQIIGD